MNKLRIQGYKKISIQCLENLLNSPQIYESIGDLDNSFHLDIRKSTVESLTPSNLLRFKNLSIVNADICLLYFFKTRLQLDYISLVKSLFEDKGSTKLSRLFDSLNQKELNLW
jgi:hypothetical protein